METTELARIQVIKVQFGYFQITIQNPWCVDKRNISRAFLRELQPRNCTLVYRQSDKQSHSRIHEPVSFRSNRTEGGKASCEGGKTGLPLHVAEGLVEAPLRVVGAPAAAHRHRPVPPASGAGSRTAELVAHALRASPRRTAEIHGVRPGDTTGALTAATCRLAARLPVDPRCEASGLSPI